MDPDRQNLPVICVICEICGLVFLSLESLNRKGDWYKVAGPSGLKRPFDAMSGAAQRRIAGPMNAKRVDRLAHGTHGIHGRKFSFRVFRVFRGQSLRLSAHPVPRFILSEFRPDGRMDSRMSSGYRSSLNRPGEGRVTLTRDRWCGRPEVSPPCGS